MNQAPTNAAEAADQLGDLGTKLEQARNVAEKHATLRDRFEQLYRQSSARALMHDEVIGLRSEDRRKAAVQDFSLSPEIREMGAKLAETMGLDGTAPMTVGDLRWLRDRAASLADSHSAKAYDARALVSAWTVVASMAKHEIELGRIDRRAA